MNPALAAYAGTARRRWRWLLWGGLIALLLNATAFATSPLYRTDARVVVRTAETGDAYAQNHAETYAALARAAPVAGRIAASHPPGTAVIDLSVRASSASQSRRSAEALVGGLIETVRTLESVPGSPPRAELVIVDPPGDPVRITPWGSRLVPGLTATALVGIALGASAAVIAELP